AKRNSENFLIEQTVSLADENQIDLLLLEDALRQLAVHDQRQARIVELRFFGGLKVNEVAYILDISERTVKREWAFAKAWLRR
ncbi:ECF-type sigma factor, partial [Escherichia coli]|nr:ECF-type sigma factor [Escherichia coli]